MNRESEGVPEQAVFPEEGEKLQVLLFRLDQEIYALEISCIHEVLEYSKVTKVPRTPDFMLGVINLRGRVVPVVDLRRQFEMTISEVTVDTCNIIIDVSLDGEDISVGILADDVREVVEIDKNHLRPPPSFGSTMDIGFIKGISQVNDDFVIVLDIAEIFSSAHHFDIANQLSGLKQSLASDESLKAGEPEIDLPDNQE
ncbi:chemotaxis protein CheW [Marinobacter sediminum]|uniref:chemotaxis protein CheW n=1 Tax=Marinobacter sediminum TaxID=256323 RepID=UPI00193AD241|nr:chemotaxis protein CheW [Marinobacter sediminum]